MKNSKIEKCRQTLEGLNAKRAGLVCLQANLSDERALHAFEGHTGNATAAKRLKELASESAKNEIDLQDLSVAIEEAARRLSEAEAEQAVAQAKANAGRALERIEQLKEIASRMDEKARDLVSDFSECLALADEARALVGVETSNELFAINLKNSLAVHFYSVFRLDMVPPDRRWTLADLADLTTEHYINRAKTIIEDGAV